ncbi:hypothetical protein KQH60_09475 [Mycetohabitans sp. B8]|uniref:hypothetical protein n=1 Tax=Mycetohabitans sp. B8 TaxID=2841845 RepID=UPI001F2325AF|nr:hypothetical protein [Mycetohabitans sp. B8]MCG1042755.1 hypothetical protein [Mycetohabitans sp. B8]
MRHRLTPALLERGCDCVECGDSSMEVYYARQYFAARELCERQHAAKARLALAPGRRLAH